MTDDPLKKIRSLPGEAGRIWRDLEAAIDGPPRQQCATCGRDISHRGKNAIYCHRTCKNRASKDRRKERGAPIPPPLAPTHCVTCDKIACPTEEAAKEAKRAIEERTGRTSEVRYYQCPDGWWHWTRRDATLNGYRIRAIRPTSAGLPGDDRGGQGR